MLYQVKWVIFSSLLFCISTGYAIEAPTTWCGKVTGTPLATDGCASSSGTIEYHWMEKAHVLAKSEDACRATKMKVAIGDAILDQTIADQIKEGNKACKNTAKSGNSYLSKSADKCDKYYNALFADAWEQPAKSEHRSFPSKAKCKKLHPAS